MLGLAIAAAIATTACPGNENENDTSPAPESGGTGVSGATAVTGELTGPIGTGASTGAR